ncbi:Echinoderm microtubule-associated protein-like 3, partial [Varanus komodoensis]
MDGYAELSPDGENLLDNGDGISRQPHWLTDLDSRLRSQEEELTLVKSALADALRRLSFYDQQIPQLLRVNSAVLDARDPAVLPQGKGALWVLPPALANDSSLPGTQRSGSREDLVPWTEKAQGFRVSVGTQTEESTVLTVKQGELLSNGQLDQVDGGSVVGSKPGQAGKTDCAGDPVNPHVPEPAKNSFGSSADGGTQGFASEVQKVHESPRTHGLGGHLPGSCPHKTQDVGEPPPEDSTDPRAGQPRAPAQPWGQETPSPEPLSEGSGSSTAASPVPAVQSLMTSKKELLRRNSSSDKPARAKQHLSKKAASSANLLNRSSSLENRIKDPSLSPGPWSSRRGNYNLEGLSTKMFLRGRPITMYIPSAFSNYEEMRMELPVEKLQLDWVPFSYGYRGRDCRSNLYVLTSGELVYFIACVVVLYHVQRRTQRHYLRHTDCVRCLAVHPDRVRVASGQMAGVDKDGKPLQPSVHIWDSSTLLTLQQIGLGSFERGVGSLAFSTADDGAYLCVIDESNEHMLSVWDCARGVKQVEIKSTNESVLTVEFNPQDSSNIITTGKSHVYFWTWSGNSLTKKQGIFGKYKKPKFIQCFVFDTNRDVLTGDSEGNILTWARVAADTRTLGKGAKETYQISKQTRAHEGSIFSLCLCRDGTVLSGGGKDRRLVQWSPNLTLVQEVE